MRTDGGDTRAVRVDGDTLTPLPAGDVGELLRLDDWAAVAAGATGNELEHVPERLASLITRPSKIWCVGLNYASHILEMGRELPEHPTLFGKFAAALTGPFDAIELPIESGQVDWEAELTVVIGRAGRRVPPSAALDHVAGYTVANDVTARDWQRRTIQFLQGKTFEAMTPLGPHLVTSDELPPGGAGLAISCAVNGEVVQASTTDDLIFDVATLVSYTSCIATLEPGDVILTGTPDGVGAGRKPPRFLADGDEVTTTIDGIGELRNVFRSPTARTAG